MSTKPKPQKKPTEKVTYELEQGQYLSNKKEDLLRHIKEVKRILLHANPGAGKTSFIRQLCGNPKKNGFNRIIFCTPFLVIQDQFKSSASKEKVHIDIEINGSLKGIVTLNSSHKVITSTFQGLKRIKDQIGRMDLLVIDEAHELLKFYQPKYVKKFHFETVSLLYHIKAHLLLMTGTPYSGLRYLLNLKTVRVKSTMSPSRLNIQYTSNNINQEVAYFAKYCIGHHGEGKVNFIFIKNKKKCLAIKKTIKAELDCNVQIFTSEHKNDEFYGEFLKSSKIKDNIQFVICTNVLSTGTNIENTNIGDVLMLRCYDPLEIVQFSRRFRQKQNVDVTIINDFSFHSKTDTNLETLKQNQEKFRKRQQVLIKSVVQLFKDHPETHDYDYEFFYDKFGKAEDLIGRIINRSIVEEAWYNDSLVKSYNNPTKLAEVLSKNSNVKVLSAIYSKTNLPEAKVDSESYKQEQRAYIEGYISKQINNPEKFLSALANYESGPSLFKIKGELKEFVDENRDLIQDESYTDETLYTDNLLLILDEVIKPVLDSYPYIKNLDATLHFIRNTKKNKRRGTKIMLFFCSRFALYFDIKNDTDRSPYLAYKENVITKDLKDFDLAITDLLNMTFNYFIGSEYVVYNEFEAYIIKHFKLKKYKLDLFKDFPFNLQNIKVKKNGSLEGLTTPFYKALANSIFLISPKRSTMRVNGKNKGVYKFIDKPENIKGVVPRKIEYSERPTKISYSLLPSEEEDSNETVIHHTKYLNSRNIILLDL